ncbi:hypothetical protein CISIN_1g038177mg [Citrus sinensis]|uniref:Uncharacterized protein n=1 Tax=Citrus sinensis TaxID=2711 RepID=A0A067DMZ9_CITSI|nr:hypothetical protein CISIN_1g038177mg [Citrus sinensis]
MCAPESSRQASKRKRKESLSSKSESRDAPIIETHLTNEDLNDVTSENSHQSCNEENLTKKKRGPTICHDVANEDGKKIVLELNNLGQPIGKSFVLYSSLYGSLVKEAVSINYDDWRYVPKQQKALLLRALEQRVGAADWVAIDQVALDRVATAKLNGGDKLESGCGIGLHLQQRVGTTGWVAIDQVASDRVAGNLADVRQQTEGDAIKKYTLQMMGKVWRAHQSRLTKRLDARPSLVKPDKWETFIKKRTSKAFMKKNSSNPSEITQIDVWIIAHTKKYGEPSSSKVVEVKEMYEAEKNSDLSEAHSKSVKNDILLKFIGPEQGGSSVARLLPHHSSGFCGRSRLTVAGNGRELQLPQAAQLLRELLPTTRRLAGPLQGTGSSYRSNGSNGLVARRFAGLTAWITSECCTVAGCVLLVTLAK